MTLSQKPLGGAGGADAGFPVASGDSLISLDGPEGRDRMLGEFYVELRAKAARLLRNEAPLLTIDPTDLVNEAALKVLKLERMSWHDRQHFFATGARLMRQVMVDAIRRRRSAKRHVPTLLFAGQDDKPEIDVEALDAALTRLEVSSPDLARIVELRFFVGLGMSEIAAVTGSSESTVKRRWRTARLWLAVELQAP